MQPPPDFNEDQFEQAQLAELRESLLGGWQDGDGSTRPLISGVSFDTVELRGEFPNRSIVALFHSSDYPGVQFGRSWRLYDELRNPEDLEYAHIHLMEDIESATGGLPPPDQRKPDPDGVVWF
jgi:hypothetical protein